MASRDSSCMADHGAPPGPRAARIRRGRVLGRGRRDRGRGGGRTLCGGAQPGGPGARAAFLCPARLPPHLCRHHRDHRHDRHAICQAYFRLNGESKARAWRLGRQGRSFLSNKKNLKTQFALNFFIIKTLAAMFDTWYTYYDYAQDYYRFSIPNPMESVSTNTSTTPATTATVQIFGQYIFDLR